MPRKYYVTAAVEVKSYISLRHPDSPYIDTVRRCKDSFTNSDDFKATRLDGPSSSPCAAISWDGPPALSQALQNLQDFPLLKL